MNKIHTASIREKLGLEDPFLDFEVQEDRVDLQGWNSDHSFFANAINIAQPKLIIELGVWKGMSAIHMARLVKEAGLECEVLADIPDI